MSVSSSATRPQDSPQGTAPRGARHARLHRLLPITAWAGGYQRRWLRYDTIAALTVIGLLLPECMAYAQIAGVPPQAGLYATLAALVIYAVFGKRGDDLVAFTATAE